MNNKNKLELELIQDGKFLRLFFFQVIQPSKIESKITLAYNQGEAMSKLWKCYPDGIRGQIVELGSFIMEDILNMIKLPEQKSPVSKQKFVCNMMMIADEYIIDRKDSAAVKKILNKIIDNEEKNETDLA